jgi:multidrug resistance efflux pump
MEDTIASANVGQRLTGESATAAKPSSGPIRPVKLTIAGSCMLAGIFVVVSTQRSIKSDNAVVTAYLSSVRVPIEGTLKDFRVQAGAQVTAGERLGEIDNARANEERIQDLDVEKREAAGQASAVDQQMLTLRVERQSLVSRAALHANAVSVRLALQAAESKALLAEKQADLAQASNEMERQQRLRDDGIISQASLEQIIARRNIAQQSVAAQQANLALVIAVAASAKQGIFTEQGHGSDVSYSAQRVDEIDMQLANLQQSSTTLRLHATALQSSLSAAADHSDLMRRADLVSPVTGTIWQVQAQQGERLNVGESVMQVIDCKQQFILAALQQDDVSSVDLGGEVRVKLSQERRVKSARIIGVSEHWQRNERLAADVMDERRQMAIVRVAFMPENARAESCSVGETAQVMFPKKRSGFPTMAFWAR